MFISSLFPLNQKTDNNKETNDQTSDSVDETNSNPERGLIGAATDNIWNVGVGAVKGISWTLSSTYNYSVSLLNRSYALKMKDKNE